MTVADSALNNLMHIECSLNICADLRFNDLKRIRLKITELLIPHEKNAHESASFHTL